MEVERIDDLYEVYQNGSAATTFGSAGSSDFQAI
jgi:hypothetical protein